MTLEMVLPLRAINDERGSDLSRARDGLIASLNRFADPGFVKRLTIVTPKGDVGLVSDICRDCAIPIQILPEDELLPVARIGSIPRRGWFLQQFIKIAFSRICREEFYITLDSDVFLLRKLDSGIFRDGRAPAKYEPVAAHPGWWDASAATLKASVSAKSFDENATFGVTPAFLKRDIASDLISTIDRLSHDSGEGDWISYLCARTHINDICWTEYSLYWTHLINTLNPADIYYAYDVYFYTHHVSEARRFLIAPHTIPRQLFAIIQSSMISQQEFSLFAKDYFDTMASID